MCEWRGTDDRQLDNATHSPDQAEKEKKRKKKNKPTNQTASGRAPVSNYSTATGGLKEGQGKEQEKRERGR